MHVTVFVVVVGNEGNLVTYRTIDGEKYEDFKALYAAVAKERVGLEKEYHERGYSIHMGVADSLASLLRSFPEIRRPRVPA